MPYHLLALILVEALERRLVLRHRLEMDTPTPTLCVVDEHTVVVGDATTTAYLPTEIASRVAYASLCGVALRPIAVQPISKPGV